LKASVVYEFGGPGQLVLSDVPDPEPGPGQVRISVHAAGTNPVDTGNRADGSWAGLTTPCILGYDVAGVIDMVGSNVDGVRVGDRVMALLGFPDGAGGYAELVVVDADVVARLEPSVSYIDGAATPLAVGTALTVLNRLRLDPGARLLVLGASGGVGLFLLQIAAAQGLFPIGVGRGAMHAQMRTCGAKACIDYTCEDVPSRAIELADGRVDAVADLVGGIMLDRSLSALRPYGAVAAIVTPTALDLDYVVDTNISLHGVLIGNDGARTRQVAAMLAEGKIRPIVSHILPLAAAEQAHRILEGKHPGGKVVLQIRA
jgi:NADPH:quinone reductase